MMFALTVLLRSKWGFLSRHTIPQAMISNTNCLVHHTSGSMKYRPMDCISAAAKLHFPQSANIVLGTVHKLLV